MPLSDHELTDLTSPHTHAAPAVAPDHDDAAAPGPYESVLALQRSAGNRAVAGVLDPVGSGGAPLDTDTRSFMESRLGADFSDVRIHTGPEATASARALGAEAYTVGTDIVIPSERWAPDTDAGRHLLAHELTHVVQQKAGPVDGTPTGDGFAVSDPGDRFEQEAERRADEAVGGAT